MKNKNYFSKNFLWPIVIIAIFIVMIFTIAIARKNNELLVKNDEVVTPISLPSLPSPQESILPADKLTKNVPILVYHRIGIPNIHASKMQIHYFVSPESFLSQMEYLKNHKYTPITFNTLVNSIIYSTALPKNPIVITFDDGWRSQYEYAFPVLKQFGFTASFFIVTSYGNYPAYMTWNMIKDLDKSGMEIGSHTIHHINLTMIPIVEADQEIVDSKKILEKELGHSITTFAYPDYGQNKFIQTLLKDSGYLGARAGWTNTNNMKETIFDLKSQEVVNNPDPFFR